MAVIRVVVIGPGLVGSCFLDQFSSALKDSSWSYANVFQLSAVVNSKKMLVGQSGEDLTAWRSAIDSEEATQANIAHLKDILSSTPGAQSVFIDCTSSQAVADQYPDWLSAGIHVITPNKKAFSGDLNLYQQIKALSSVGANDKKPLVYHESTVGAGLPILQTICGLLATGDRILRIEGIFSGTLSYLFNNFSAPGGASQAKFSDMVVDAKAKGFTVSPALGISARVQGEVCGNQPLVYRNLILEMTSMAWMLLARYPRNHNIHFSTRSFFLLVQVVILGRMIGLNLTLETLDVENIVPEALRTVASADEFLAQLPAYDDHFAKLNAEAESSGEILRYVGVVDPSGHSSVRLQR